MSWVWLKASDLLSTAYLVTLNHYIFSSEQLNKEDCVAPMNYRKNIAFSHLQIELACENQKLFKQSVTFIFILSHIKEEKEDGWFLCLMAYQLFLGYLMLKPFS